MEPYALPENGLERLTPEEGASFLLRYRSQHFSFADSEQQAAPDLARYLGGFLLPLQMVKAYLRETDSSLQSCLHVLEKQEHLLPSSANDPYRALGLSSTLILTHLEVTCPRAVEITRMCAFLAPEHIPEELFAGTVPARERSAGEQATSREVIERLLAFSLLSRQQDTMTLSIHPLLQSILRDHLEAAERERSLERVASEFYHFLCSGGSITTAMLPYYLAHIWRIAQYGEIWTFTHLEVAALFSWGASLFSQQGSYPEAEALFQHALAIREHKLGRKHRSTAVLIHRLGVVKARLGCYDEACDLLYEATSTRSRLLGPTNADTLQSLTELAAILYAAGKSEEAVQAYQQAIFLTEQAQGPDSPAILPLLERLAQLFISVARFSEAEPLLARAYTLTERLTETGPEKAGELLYRLALVLMAQGKWEEAETLFRRLVSSWETIQEQVQPAFLEVQCQLAQVLIAREQWEEAETILLRVLPIQQRVLGSAHQETLQSQEQLALLYTLQDRSDEAREISEQIRQIREIQSGEAEISEVIAGLIGHAGIDIGQQHFARAEQLLQQALDLSQFLPEDDELARATILQALAIAQAGLKQYPQATTSLQQALALRERLLGPEHIETQSARQQVALLTPLLTSGASEE